MRDVSAFGTAQYAIRNAERLRIVMPASPSDDTGTDLQAEYRNRTGAAYWLLLVTFPESLLRWPCEDCGDYHQRGPV